MKYYAIIKMKSLGIYPRKMKTYVHTKTCTQMLIAALFRIATKLEITQISNQLINV